MIVDHSFLGGNLNWLHLQVLYLQIQPTKHPLNGRLIVLVTGYLTGKDFAQSFFLAPQDEGYFVLNDIFRNVDKDAHQLGNVGLMNLLFQHNHQNENSYSLAAVPVGAHPPVPEDVQLAMAFHASIESAIAEEVSVDLKVSDVRSKPETRDSKEDGSNCVSSSCAICLDTPVEGACIPCGHMAGCMSCLKEINAKKSGCPVCHAKTDQVVRLYAV